jgi:diphthamide synthase (EF-2-diphthine--ammonia ligase)
MVASGVRARIVSVDTCALPAECAGGEFDAPFLDGLPPGVDPCGENGEFHTFVYDGPMFRVPVPVAAGDVRQDGRFAFAELWPASSR